jgi:hypothetical protein
MFSSLFCRYPLLIEDILFKSFTLSILQTKKALAKTKRSAPGLDNIPSWVFQEFANILAETIAEIFNLSLDAQQFSAAFKYTLVTVIPKKKNPSLKEHRPFLLLPILSKVFERLILFK